LNRFRHAFERLRPAIFDHEQTGYELKHRVGYQGCVRRGGRLHARRDVGHVTECLDPLIPLMHHHLPGMNADPHGDLKLVMSARRAVSFGNSVEDRETGTDRTLGVIVMRLRISEERHHPIAEILSDLAAELSDRVARGSMIRGQYFMPLLGIETSSDFSRVH
jgi:hypothetical protein